MRVLTRNTRFILYTALALLPFYVSAPVYAQTPNASAEPCDYAALARRRQANQEFKQAHLTQLFTVPADNQDFLDNVIYRLASDEGAVYFHVENAVLKMLNDKVLEDKELSAATLNLYKKLFFTELANYPEVAKRIYSAEGAAYSDYKQIRLSATGKTPEEDEAFRALLSQIHDNVGRLFAGQMETIDGIRELYAEHRGLVGDPANWNLAGIADSAAKAALLARRARRLRPGDERKPGVPQPPHSFTPVDAVEVASELRNIETLRQEFARTLKNDRIVGGDGILTLAALDILRRAQGDPTIRTQKDYREYIRRRFKIRFDQDLSDDEIDRLQRYYHLANEMAPSVYIKEQEPIALADLDKAQHGVLSFDIGGQNSLNMRASMVALREVVQKFAWDEKHPNQLVNAALSRLFTAQQVESAGFEKTISTIGKAIDEAGITGPRTTSGDDGTQLPEAPLSLIQELALMGNLKDHWDRPNTPRFTSQPQNYVDTAQPLGKAERFTLISQGERIEKDLRELLEVERLVPYEDLIKMVFTVRMNPRSDGSIVADVIFAKLRPNGIDRHNWSKLIREVLSTELPAHIQLGKIYNADVLGRGFRNRPLPD